MLRNIKALTKKEFYQIIRDPSSIIIAFVLPLILLFLFGFGINFDTNSVRLGIIQEDFTPEVSSLIDTFSHNRFLVPFKIETRKKAEKLLVEGKIRGFIVIPNNFTKDFKDPSQSAKIQVIADGSEPNTAKFVVSYAQGVLGVWANLLNVNNPVVVQSQNINVIPRVWYNPALKSTYFVLPGSLAIIMTMIGTILTALVIAREWERGTMEALLTTQVTKFEFLISKYIAYFILGIASMIFCLLVIVYAFGVPFYGSIFWLLTSSSLFMLCALGMGFLISTYTKDQFVASQFAGMAGFLPSLMLSGLIYEISSMPLPIRIFTYFIPARYFVSCIGSLFLSGTILKVLVINCAFLLLFSVLMFWLVYRITEERLGGCL